MLPPGWDSGSLLAMSPELLKGLLKLSEPHLPSHVLESGNSLALQLLHLCTVSSLGICLCSLQLPELVLQLLHLGSQLLVSSA